MTELTLLRQHSPLADPLEQVRQLESTQVVPPFAAHVSRHDLPELQASGLDVLQVNVGRVCNQTCAHCHVDAGPEGTREATI